MGRKYVYYSKKDIMIDSEISKEYIRIKKEMLKLEKELQPIEDRLKEELRDTMRKIDVDKFISNGLEVKLTKDSVRNNFDSKALKEDNLELYNKYIKTTNVKGNLSINLERGI